MIQFLNDINDIFIEIFQKKKLNMKKYIKRICLIVIFLLCVFVFFLSLYFRLNPIEAVHLLSREVALEGIEFVVEHFYDPWSQKRKVAHTGPKAYFSPGVIDNAKALEAFLRNRGLMVKKIYFCNYFPRTSRFSFSYAPFDPMRRKIALEKYSLEKIQKEYKDNDFQMALALMAYVKGLWKHDTDKGFDPRHFDAFRMIELGRHGKGFWCQVYAMTYVELASYLGLPARIVALSQDGYFSGHAVAEVWSNVWNKWFVVDPDFNIYYARNSVPLNAIELHKLWEKRKENEVSVVKLKPRPQGYDVETRSKHKLLEYYQYVRIDLRNDYHWNFFPKGHPDVSDENTLLWYDEFLKPVLSFERKTNNLSDFYWSLNYVYIQLLPIKKSNLVFKVFLHTDTPWFSYFKININGKIVNLKRNFLEWSLAPGYNFLEICPVNKGGLCGICSKISVSLEEGE